MFLEKLLIFICLQITAVQISAEFYSSIHEMTKLIKYENYLLQKMQKFLTENENKLEFLKERLAEFELEKEEALEMGMEYLENPVNKYLLAKRLTIDWERIDNLMHTNSGHAILQKIEQYQKRKFGDDMELIGAIEGFLRIQEVYRIKTEHMAAGIFNRVSYNSKLDAHHCFDIGKYAIINNNPRLGHSWLMAALKRFKQSNKISLTDNSEVLYYLATAKRLLGDIKGANQTFLELIQSNGHDEKYSKAYNSFLKDTRGKNSTVIDYTQEHEPIPKDLLSTDPTTRYKFTCTGHLDQSPREERDLRCGYLTETHPFLTIAPLKVEELNHNPLLVVYHDVISDNEIAVIKNLTDDNIQRATVMGRNESIVSPTRTSQFVFLPKTVHKVLEIIDQRVTDMTNLNMNIAEDHQFANYGIGGHYGEHHDYFDEEMMKTDGRVSNSSNGNRIATVLFYLTDVEQGGATAFPYLRRLLTPKKGSAAFWYNLHASGDVDERTLHGACPIIVGSKWVLNRWIRERHQDDRRPCELFNESVYL